MAVIGDGTPDNWELFQFTSANLVDTRTYEVSGRLRGQLGTDGLMPQSWPIGCYFVLLDGRPKQIDFAMSSRGGERHYRIVPVSDPSYQHRVASFQGNGLRPYAPVHLRALPNGARGKILTTSSLCRPNVNGAA